MTIEIEKNIPIPPDRHNVYQFGTMTVGDSSFWNVDGRERLASAASNYGRRTKKKFTVRAVKGGGYRVWRTK